MPRGACGIEMRIHATWIDESVSYAPERVHFYAVCDTLNCKVSQTDYMATHPYTRMPYVGEAGGDIYILSGFRKSLNPG